MNFTSIEFALFLPVVFVIYWLVLGRSLRGGNLWIVAASYLFYGWWDWRFCFLLAATTLVTFGCALPRRHRRWWCTASIVFNIATLILFKYFGFFGNGLRRLFEAVGWAMDWFTIDILLPVGISFYTLQAISYSVDVYRRDIAPTRDLVAFAGFLSFFPQLVAGPIERSTQLLPQFLKPRRWDYDRAVEGMRLILWGLFKKCAVADMLVCLVEPLWDSYAVDLPLHAAFSAVIAFAIQVYADFSGYSDIARGAAKLLGFELMVNFRFPFFSRNLLEFWHRWHISLMEWFTRYVYIPLGGSRSGNRLVNVMIVFLLSGLWHGANVCYVVWGATCGLFYIATMLAGAQRHNPKKEEIGNRSNLWQMVLTFILFAIPMVFFRSPNLDIAITSYARVGWKSGVLFALMIGAAYVISRVRIRYNFTAIFSVIVLLGVVCFWVRPDWFYTVFFLRRGMIMALLMFMVEWRARHLSFGLSIVPRRRWIRIAAYLALYLLIISSAAESDEPFLYFQF